MDAELRSLHLRLVAGLTRRFGVAHFALAENAAQEAFLRAVEHFGSVEPQHERWLFRVAHNQAVDALRKEKRLLPLPDESVSEAPLDEPDAASSLDDELRLIFLCCHPVLARSAQIALTLRVAYGFDTAQIARAFLCDERTIGQRIVRAKQRLRDEGARFEVPSAEDLPERIEAILDVLYQLFSEGHSSSYGDAGIDDALCQESLRLVRLLTDDARSASPAAEALRALFCFHAARFEARRADDGSLLLLHEQDRSLWDPLLMREGFELLARSARGTQSSRFHVEAGILACHAASPSYASTDWAQILELYDMLHAIAPSPVVDVNRAFAVAMCNGALSGLDELDAIPERELVSRYPYALAVYAELHAALGHLDQARAYLDRALAQQASPAERKLLERKRAALG